jgi:hypothetical protein
MIPLLAAQDTPLPSPDTQDPAPSVTPAPSVPPPQLIPPDILPPPDTAPVPPPPNIPTIPQLDEGFAIKPMNEAAEKRRLHIEWRKIRNRTENHPKVKAALDAAEKARTDLERRKLLREYYEIFYARAIAIGPPDMKQYLIDRKNEQLVALPQPRVRPDPPPREKKSP